MSPKSQLRSGGLKALLSKARTSLRRLTTASPVIARSLTASESALLPPAVSALVDLSEVRIVNKFHNPVAALFNQSVVRGWRIFWAGAPAETTSLAERTHLAHELVHVWQYEYLKRSGLEILIDRRYRYELRPGAPFSAYGFEQQAAIVEDFVRLSGGAEPRWTTRRASLADYAAVIATCARCGRDATDARDQRAKIDFPA